MSTETQPETAFQFFHPVEHHILSEYFGVEPPECACSRDIDQQLQTFNDKFVSLVSEESSKPTSNDNAVARLLLQGVQGRLPQWATVNLTTGDINFARNVSEQKDNCVSLLPQYLFGINWADTAPGISWPEEYYVTFVPHYERYVVTRSQDSPDVYGYCDLPIDHFDKDLPLVEGVKSVIFADWQEQRGNDQSRWVESWSTGSPIGLAEPDRWADEVWYDPTRILTNLLEDNEDICGTRHDVLSDLEQVAIKEAIEDLPDHSDCY